MEVDLFETASGPAVMFKFPCPPLEPLRTERRRAAAHAVDLAFDIMARHVRFG